jgi:hypothetical protein
MRGPLLTSVVTLAATFAIAEIALRVVGFRNPPAGAPMRG